jgi:hypothetical protein
VEEVLTAWVEIEIDGESLVGEGEAEGLMRQLRGVLDQPGFGVGQDVAHAGVRLVVRAVVGENGSARGRRVVVEPPGLTVRPTGRLLADVERVVGAGCVRAFGGVPGWLRERSKRSGSGRRAAAAG